MIKITSTNDVIIVEGDELTRHYPYNGTLVIPKNSTIVVLDEKSEMVLFKSASNYDTLFTGILGLISIEDEIVTRDNIIEKFNAISNVIVGGNVDLFEVVQSLPTENISDNKVYLLLDSNGIEGNTYVEYLYVNGQWEELGKFKVNVDLSGYATEQWVNEQGFLKEHQDISNLATKAELNAKQDVISDLETIRSGAAKGATALQSVPSGYATEQWINEQGFLKEHQDISNLATKAELNTKQDTINDLETIRSGAAKGATALQSVPSGYATEQWVNEQGFLKEHQDISNLATKAELATKQDTINDLDTIRSGAAKGATALQSVPSTYALKSDILSAKTDSRYTTYDVQNPVLSGNTILLQNEVTDSRKYHTLGYEKTITAIVPVQKYINITRNYNGVPSMDTDIESGIGFDGSNINGEIPFTLDKINAVTNLMHYEVSYVERDSEGNVTGGGEKVIADVIYDPNTKLLSVPGTEFTFAQIQRSDTNTYLFGAGTDGTEYFENGRTYYNFEQNPLQEGATLIWMPYYSLNLYWEYSVAINGIFYQESSVTTDDKPERLNDYIRYSNNVKAYILTDKNTTFKTINGQQITGNGDITIDTNVDLSNYATKSELNAKQDTISDLDSIRSGAALGATALQSVPDTYALKSEIPDITTKQDTLVSGTNIKTVNGNSLLGSGNIEVATKEELATKQDVISDLETIRSGAALGATALQSVPDTYALKSEIPDITTKQDTLVSGTNIKTVNGTSLLGSGNIVIEASSDNVPTVQTTKEGTTSNYIYSSGRSDKYGVISDFYTAISYEQGRASIHTDWYYWGNTDNYMVDGSAGWAIEGATTSQAGLMSASDKSKLDGIDLSTKQDTLVSGTNIKTVNGTSLLGSGNIEVAKEWIGTQAEYDALPTKDNNTTYYITE